MTDLVLISPSQVRTFQECPRKWGFDKIDQIPVATSPGAAFGSLVHARLEGYFAHGVDVGDDRAGKVASALATCYPPPGDGSMLVEKQLVVEADGFAWRGKIDLIYQEDNGKIIVCDHKTLRQPELYALDSVELFRDVQAVIYSHLALKNFDVDWVHLQWTYAATQGAPKPYAVRVLMDRDHVAKHLPALEATAREILAARSATTANDLPPNLNACGNYGGCPYAEHCVRTKEQRMSAIFNDDEENDMSSLREILQQRAGATTTPKPESGNGKIPPPVPPELHAGKLPPPRPDVNAPEAPKDEQTRVDISKRVGAGGDARALVEAEAQGKDLDDAAAKAKAEAFKKKSPKQYEILAHCGVQTCAFARRKDAGQAGIPFAHGRTLNAMVKDGIITVEEVSSKVSNVTATAAGLELLGMSAPNLEVVQATVPEVGEYVDRTNAHFQAQEAVKNAPLVNDSEELVDPVLQSAANAPLDDEPTTAADLAALADESPPIRDEDLKFDDAPPDGATARDVWLRLAMKWGNTPRVVEDLFGQYLRHFPTG